MKINSLEDFSCEDGNEWDKIYKQIVYLVNYLYVGLSILRLALIVLNNWTHFLNLKTGCIILKIKLIC